MPLPRDRGTLPVLYIEPVSSNVQDGDAIHLAFPRELWLLLLGLGLKNKSDRSQRSKPGSHITNDEPLHVPVYPACSYTSIIKRANEQPVTVTTATSQGCKSVYCVSCNTHEK